MVGRLAPHHREKLARLIAATPEFTPDDATVALELVDTALGNPDSDEYRFILFEEAERVLGFACFGSASMAEGSFDLYWMVVDREARRRGLRTEKYFSLSNKSCAPKALADPPRDGGIDRTSCRCARSTRRLAIQKQVASRLLPAGRRSAHLRQISHW